MSSSKCRVAVAPLSDRLTFFLVLKQEIEQHFVLVNSRRVYAYMVLVHRAS